MPVTGALSRVAWAAPLSPTPGSTSGLLAFLLVAWAVLALALLAAVAWLVWVSRRPGDDRTGGSTTFAGLPRRYVPPLALCCLLLGANLVAGGLWIGLSSMDVDPPPRQPDPDFEFEYDATRERVRITPDGGTRLTEDNTDRLVVLVDCERRETLEPPVRPDDAVELVGVQPGSQVRIDRVRSDGTTVTEAWYVAHPGYPDGKFGLAYRESDGGYAVTVHYYGDGSFTSNTTRRITVLVDGERRASFALPVSDGDRVRLADVEAGATVTVRWVGPRGERRGTAGEWELPS